MFAYCLNNPSNCFDSTGRITAYIAYNDAVALAQELAAIDGPYPVGDVAAVVVIIGAGIVWLIDNWQQVSADISGAINNAYDEVLIWFAKNRGNSPSGSNYSPMGHSNGNAPRNNKDQNSQFRWIVRRLNLTKDQARRLHDEITGQGYSYQEIIEIAKSMFNIV